MYLDIIKKYPKYLLYSMSHSFTSCLGQTFFIALFIPYLQKNIDFSSHQFGILYSIATFLSALFLSIIGRWIDYVKLNTYSLFSILILFLSMLLLGFSKNILLTTIGLLGIRLAGQSLMAHIHSTSISKFFNKERGTALSISGIGQPIGEAIFPIFVVYSISHFGWQFSWLSITIICFVCMFLISQFSLKKSSPFLQATANNTFTGEYFNKSNTLVYIRKNWKPKEVLKDPLFYFILPNFFVAPFLLTGFFFYQVELSKYKMWGIEVIASAFVIFGIVRIFVGFASGYFIDKFSAKNIFPFLSIGLFFSFIIIFFAKGIFFAFIYLGLIAFDLALGLNAKSALLGEVYGIQYLGSIKSIFRTIVVIATGSGTWIFGILLSIGYTFTHIIILSLIMTFLSIVLALLARIRLQKYLQIH